MRASGRALAVLGALAAIAGRGAAAAPQGSACDRDCLIGFAVRYAAALVAHAPERVPTVSGVKFTENLVPLKFG